MGDSINTFYFNGRDSLLAANLEWVASELFPSEKIIVFSHNIHIGKVRSSNQYYWQPDRIMGEMLSSEFKQQAYIMALNAYSGEYWYNEKHYRLCERKKGIEKYLHDKGYKYCILNVSESRKLPQTSHRECAPLRMKLYDAYDGMLFIDNITPKTLVEAGP